MPLHKRVIYYNTNGEVYKQDDSYAAQSPRIDKNTLYARVIIQRLSINRYIANQMIQEWIVPFGYCLNVSNETLKKENNIYRKILSGTFRGCYVKVGQLVDGEDTVEYT